MQAKLFKVRDTGCLYSVLAVSYQSGCEDATERAILERVGLCNGGYRIQLTDLEDGHTERDRFKWHGKGRTLFLAHGYIEDNWDSLQSGDEISIPKVFPDK